MARYISRRRCVASWCRANGALKVLLSQSICGVTALGRYQESFTCERYCLQRYAVACLMAPNTIQRRREVEGEEVSLRRYWSARFA